MSVTAKRVGGTNHTWRTLPTAQAMRWPSGLKRAALTDPLKLKWCSSTLRRLLMSRERPSSSMASSRAPSGLRHSVRICEISSLLSYLWKDHHLDAVSVQKRW